MIPFEELAASGIDRSTAARLNYRCNADGGWEIPYLDPQGQPYTYGDGVPFVRRKLKPGSDPKYLTPTGAGNRPYLSPLLPEGYLGGHQASSHHRRGKESRQPYRAWFSLHRAHRCLRLEG